MSKKRKSEPLSDWRSTIFYWRGNISITPSDSGKDATLIWEGSWEGSADGFPKEEEFQSSLNKFRLVCNDPKNISGDSITTNETDGITTDVMEKLINLEGSLKGSYLLDQGDGQGLQRFEDHSHEFATSEIITDKEDKFLVVSACGSTEFGRFISHGRITLATSTIDPPTSTQSKTLTLTLARRYVMDKDSRSSYQKGGGAKLLLKDWLGGKKHDPDSIHKELNAEEALPWRVLKK